MTGRAALLAALAIGGCGGSSDPSPVDRQPVSEQQLATALGLTQTGADWSTPSGCSVAVLLTTPQEVALYADAGDPVVANPERSVGVKLEDDSESCRAELLLDLENMP